GEASAQLRAAFENGDDPVTLTRRLEAALDAGRDAWPLAAIRMLWDALWPLEPARARSAEHEARWLNLAGFRLRPGFGDPGEAERGRATESELWALARLGARVPVYGPLNCVVARDAATAWTERLLAAEWPRPEAYAFALAQLARATGDRERDLDRDLRERLARRLETAPHGEPAARLVRQPVALEARGGARLVGRTL